ncbi:hypothetical protein MPH_03877 [Macrophomina phaseolina MS6]|uniref:S-acyl fatty acid synthase thioesterase n=1 Tax=Macrophomina phaseolina (strain MS6) TaxID=1126212 RepID=K2R8U6_MACPH|nr:hypothetical protein MPH_03877 [Macrophomina phaseolina MS6]
MFSTTSTPATSLCSTPELSPPLSHSPTIPLTISQGHSSITYHFTARNHRRARQLVSQFKLSNIKDTPTPAELAATFLSYLSGCVPERQVGDDHILHTCLKHFQDTFLKNDDIHSLAARLDVPCEAKHDLIRNFYTAAAFNDGRYLPSALLSAAHRGSACIYTIFGGQGNTESFFEDLRDLHHTYEPLLASFVRQSAGLLLALSRDQRARDTFYETGLDVAAWLASPSSTPERSFLIKAPVSFPLIGLLQLMNYMVACTVLGLSPGEFRHSISGTTGHSQGIVVAAVTAAADSWDSFYRLSAAALSILFWIGVRSQEAFPQTSISPEVVADALANDEGTPTPMLSIRDLPQRLVEKELAAANKHLSPPNQISVSLINDSRNNIVVAGSPTSLAALNVRLRRMRAPSDLDQTRIPFSKRKPTFTTTFLPISSPFHVPSLSRVTRAVMEDLREVKINSSCLGIPVYHTLTGEDISNVGNFDLVPVLVRMITEEPVRWELATRFEGATHIVEFGPGGPSGIGALTSRMKDGTGVHVILADRMDVSGDLGCKVELFSPRDSDIHYGTNWAEEYQPRLVCAAGRTMVDTRLSRQLGVPPIIVGGMTPTTVHPDFVAATMQAGFHIELAGGGYHNPQTMEKALLDLAGSIPSGRGITVNLIYANPRAMNWQLALVKRLRSEGIPIDGLSIGAGVPSPEIADQYFHMGLRHISFKPGSARAIEAVLDIARLNPTFPVILQWTGGRGGGHHSCEDFHQPMLQKYPKIRRCKNIILVAGSGFGSAADTYPYLTGNWSLGYGYPPMPFDGCLFGSRMMVAKEAHTSQGTKRAIIAAKGLPNDQWEMTYKGSASENDIITVISEMGEPMHMIATRGARFWADMDERLFNKPPAQQLRFLRDNREHVIQRLNQDFQKVWFGLDDAGCPVDLERMTYDQVVSRLIELLSYEEGGAIHWIDASYQCLVVDFLRRVEQRFSSAVKHSIPSIFMTPDGLKNISRGVFAAYQCAREQFLHPQDVSFFLHLCQRKGQKPIPFIPAFDENFQTYFKKDSLWQSENLDKVVGKDAGRVCILHGPVAARFSDKEEPVKDILDRIHIGHIDALKRDFYAGDGNFPSIEYMAGQESTATYPENTTIIETESDIMLHLPGSTDDLPSAESVRRFLAGHDPSWRAALFSSEIIQEGNRYQENPLKRIIIPVAGQCVQVKNHKDNLSTRVVLSEPLGISQVRKKTVEISFSPDTMEISVVLTHHQTAATQPAELLLKFRYQPEVASVPIQEILHDRLERVKSFYWKTWFADEPRCPDATAEDVFRSGYVILNADTIRGFANTVGNRSQAFTAKIDASMEAPLDLGIVVAWKAIMKPLFAINADLLKLVHLSNQFKMYDGEQPLHEGDVVTTTCSVTAIINQESGKMVEVVAVISRSGSAVMEITSQFLYRGACNDSENTFRKSVVDDFHVRMVNAKDVAVLNARLWYKSAYPQADLLNRTLRFRLQQYTRNASLSMTGDVSCEGRIIGSVEYHSMNSTANPVLAYLQRHGEPVQKAVPLDIPVPVEGSDAPFCVKVPESNAHYAQVSGDFNPIHASHTFAAYIGLPGTITHGMHTSAAVRSFLDITVAKGCPSRVRKYSASFQAMVLPGDLLTVTIYHTAMLQGRKVIKLEARNSKGEVVMSADAEVDQPSAAYIFTGQGSQRKGMGMELREKSPAAASIWMRADEYFQNNYGFRITTIVEDDPKELTVHFGGPKGRRIRENYLSILRDAASSPHRGAFVRASQMYRALHAPRCISYTFRSHLGLLSATQFTQPALTIMEVARFADLRARGLVPEEDEFLSFAGHSLGEYGALAALGGDFMRVESLAAITFVRGLTMQMAVTRDASGRSAYSMCAVNPSKVCSRRSFDETSLREVVAAIVDASEGEWLLEIVNYNIKDLQYICAGDVRALASLTDILNRLVQDREPQAWQDPQRLMRLVRQQVERVRGVPQPIDYERGPATVPLKQIDVPFHSSFLAGGVDTYRLFLKKHIRREDIASERLVGKWIPNVTGRPFGLSRTHFEDMYRATNSPRLRDILDDWERH